MSVTVREKIVRIEIRADHSWVDLACGHSIEGFGGYLPEIGESHTCPPCTFAANKRERPTWAASAEPIDDYRFGIHSRVGKIVFLDDAGRRWVELPNVEFDTVVVGPYQPGSIQIPQSPPTIIAAGGIGGAIISGGNARSGGTPFEIEQTGQPVDTTRGDVTRSSAKG